MTQPLNILILGASYGSLLASRLLQGGHNVRLVCVPEEAELINREGFRVRLPVRGRAAPVELDSRQLPGSVTASGPLEVDPSGFDLVCLAMQEPQYRSPGVRTLLESVAQGRRLCMSIMNMPPLPYLRRIPGLDTEALRPAYADSTLWDGFDPSRVTLCSPDPQAVRPPGEPANRLVVTLPTNFKVAAFADPADSTLLARLQNDIESTRFDAAEGPVDLPVKLKLHASVFVPLAKWAMLLAGNYRCVTPAGAREINRTVHDDLAESRSVYDFVVGLCVSLGAAPADMVPFEKYAAAAQGLSRPSSAARALFAGAQNIERADKLVQLIARQKGRSHPVIDATVALVDAQLERNRRPS